MRPLATSAAAIAILIVAMSGLDFAWAQNANARPNSTVEWASWIRAIWPILVVVVGAIGTGLYLGLVVRFPTIAAFNSLKTKVAELEQHRSEDHGRLKRVEELCTETPTRVDLQEDISELGARMAGMEGKMDGVGQQLGTTNTYLHTLIERGLKG